MQRHGSIKEHRDGVQTVVWNHGSGRSTDRLDLRKAHIEKGRFPTMAVYVITGSRITNVAVKEKSYKSDVLKESKKHATTVRIAAQAADAC